MNTRLERQQKIYKCCVSHWLTGENYEAAFHRFHMSERIFRAMTGWKVFILSGPDRKSFLHGLVTNDVKGLSPGRELPCCLLTPKGKLQAQFWTYDQGETLLLAFPPETA